MIILITVANIRTLHDGVDLEEGKSFAERRFAAFNVNVVCYLPDLVR